MNITTQSDNAGLYIHIPFCIQKCPYCDFYSVTDLALKPGFLKALIAEMRMVAAEGLCFDTLYIGGGTPSVCDAREIEHIIRAGQQNFQLRSGAEITIEVNPGTASFEQLKGYREAGINRLNIGVQSFKQKNLDFLGRIHAKDEACAVIEKAGDAGFINIGLDLIYGLPGQSQRAWRQDLERAVEYLPAHIACYMLTYEKGTPLYEDLKSNRIQPQADDDMRTLFETTIEHLEGNGYWQYEISNFARKATDQTANISRHNVKYWTRAPYLGLGPSAHSFIEPQRYWNLSAVDRYIEAIESGRLPVADREVLSREQQIIEAIYLGLRMTNGIDLVGFRQKFGIDFRETYKDAIDELKNRKQLNAGPTHVALTRQGRAYVDRIASLFIGTDGPVAAAEL